jgi:deoxyribonuclease V
MENVLLIIIHSRAFDVDRRKTFAKNYKNIKNQFDLNIIDGDGILHPRKCGLVSYVGITFDNTTIGVAKNLLCESKLENNYIEFYKTILGFRFNKEGIYICIGHN